MSGRNGTKAGSKNMVVGILALLLLAGLGVALFLLLPVHGEEPALREKATARKIHLKQETPSPARPEVQHPAQYRGITKFATKEARAEALAKILAAMKQRKEQAPLEVNLIKPDSSDQEVLDYVREPWKKIRPLLRECYRRHIDDVEEIGGVITMVFTIVSDEELGGLIETSETVGDGPVTAAESLAECLRESMYAMRLPALSGVKRIRMEMPIILSTPATLEQVKKIPRQTPKIQVIGYEEEAQ